MASDGDRVRVRRVDARGGEPAAVREPGDRPLGPVEVDVREHHVLEEVATLGDRRDRGSDSTGADHEDAHGRTLPAADIRIVDPVGH